VIVRGRLFFVWHNLSLGVDSFPMKSALLQTEYPSQEEVPWSLGAVKIQRAASLMFVFGAILGAAGQNVAFGIGLVLGFVAILAAGKSWGEVISVLRRPHASVLWSAVCLIAMALATLVNSDAGGSLAFLGGYSWWLLLPLLAPLILSGTPEQTRTTAYVLSWGVAVCTLIVGLAALSQFWWGWKISGTSLISAEFRGRAFWSHPLSLAYAAILIFPPTLTFWIRAPKDPRAIMMILGVVLALFSSASRVVQLVAAAVVIWNVWTLLRGRARSIALVMLTATVIGIFSTHNPISERFLGTFKPNSDRTGAYVDDRLVFWHVHLLMAKDRPLLGHGMGTTESYRSAWYDRVVSSDFVKRYPAHNMWLQVLVNAGLVGFVLFVGWWRSVLSMTRQLKNQAWMQGLVALMVAGLTQNAFQDSVVRNVLALSVAWIIVEWRFSRQSVNAN
jgi:O-antigen ligase